MSITIQRSSKFLEKEQSKRKMLLVKTAWKMIIPKQNDLFIFLQTFNMRCLSQFICYVITYIVLFLLLFLVCVCVLFSQCIINYLESRNSSYFKKKRFHSVFSILVCIFVRYFIYNCSINTMEIFYIEKDEQLRMYLVHSLLLISLYSYVFRFPLNDSSRPPAKAN